MPHALSYFAPRPGLRGTALLACGAGWTIYGISILSTPRIGLSRGSQLLTAVIPLTWWGVIWIVCAAVSIISAFLKPGRDYLGFAAAALPPASWALAFNFAWITGTYPQAWLSIPTWMVPLVLLFVVASLSARHTALLRRLQSLEALDEGHVNGRD